MSTAVYSEPYKLLAGILAIAVHGAFFALLYFGFTWQSLSPATMSADLWGSLPDNVASVAPPAEPKVEEIAPSPPEPEVETAVPPAQPEEAVKPEIALPDTSLAERQAAIEKALQISREKAEQAAREEAERIAREKAEREKAERMAREKAEREKAEREKAERVAREKAEREKAKRLAREKAERERVAREKAEHAAREEAERVAREKAEQAARERAEKAAAIGRVVDEYTARIVSKIRRNIIMPPDVPDDARAEFLVTLLPGGTVLSAKLTRPSGSAAYDNAVERAILKSQPLPLPADVAMFSRFRELELVFKPIE